MLLRAKVEDTNDPLNIGRIKVRVYGFHDELPIEDLPWAEACFPLGGDENYGIFAVPDVGSTVWVSFEMDDKLQPDPNCPVWLGTWYGSGESPTEADREKKVIIKTKNGHKIVISDKLGEEGVFIEDKNGNKVEIKTDTDEININVNQNLNIKSQAKTEEFQQGSLQMSNWSISGDITLQGNLFVLGDITNTGAIANQGSITTTSTITATGAITTSGALIASGGLMTNPAGLKLDVDTLITTYNSHTHTDSAGGTTSPPAQTL